MDRVMHSICKKCKKSRHISKLKKNPSGVGMVCSKDFSCILKEFKSELNGKYLAGCISQTYFQENENLVRVNGSTENTTEVENGKTSNQQKKIKSGYAKIKDINEKNYKLFDMHIIVEDDIFVEEL